MGHGTGLYIVTTHFYLTFKHIHNVRNTSETGAAKYQTTNLLISKLATPSSELHPTEMSEMCFQYSSSC